MQYGVPFPLSDVLEEELNALIQKSNPRENEKIWYKQEAIQ